MTIQPKIHRGHFVPVAVIGSMAAILLHEPNLARGIQAKDVGINSICRNVTPATGRARNSPCEENSHSTGTARTVVLIASDASTQRISSKHPVRYATVLCALIRPARCRCCRQPRKRAYPVPCATGSNKIPRR
ncbi:hypothetical protein ACIXHM_01775 [Bacteroides fragilis]|uniref:hypothetical protein n=1 Tax=Phocaeicola vulgatus TaxID=821 RepID=UPI0038540F6B|nr:hypothetical protein [Bacteroides fragilis]